MLQHLALGSNLGHRGSTMRAAIAAIGRLGLVVRVSPSFETTPVGPARYPFLNAALALECTLEPRALIAELLQIEAQLGRVRAEHQGDRIIDLDLLLAGERVVDEPAARVPHPELHRRGFVLAPLVCIAPEVIVPRVGHSVRALFTAWARTGAGVHLSSERDAPAAFGYDPAPLSACGAQFCAPV